MVSMRGNKYWGIRIKGSKGQKGDRPYARNQDETGAIQMLADSYAQGGSGNDYIANLLQNFKGDWGELQKFLEVAGPMIDKREGQFQADKLSASKGMKFMENEANWDMGALSAYGPQAGAIGEGVRRSTAAGEQRLATAGLGRSSMRAALKQNVMQQGVTAQSNAFAAAQQRAAQNRMMSASSLLDAHRMVAQVAMGQSVTPRTQLGEGDSGPSAGAGAAAGAAGGIAAGSAAGPFGAVLGGAAGAVAGWLGAK